MSADIWGKLRLATLLQLNAFAITSYALQLLVVPEKLWNDLGFPEAETAGMATVSFLWASMTLLGLAYLLWVLSGLDTLVQNKFSKVMAFWWTCSLVGAALKLPRPYTTMASVNLIVFLLFLGGYLWFALHLDHSPVHKHEAEHHRPPGHSDAPSTPSDSGSGDAQASSVSRASPRSAGRAAKSPVIRAAKSPARSRPPKKL
jgi:hypothetical protein